MVTKGKGSQLIDFVMYPIEKNKLFFIYPGQIHIIEDAINVEGLTFSFTEDFLLSSKGIGIDEFTILNQSGAKNSINITQVELNYLYSTGNQMYEESLSDCIYKYKSLYHLVNLFLIKSESIFLKQNIFNDKTENTLVRKYLNLVKENFKSNQKVSEYADMLNITPGHLNDTIKLYTGKSASNFIKERILLELKRCLLFEVKTIKEIAFELKFKNPSYFSAFVKKNTGKSPESLKEILRKKYK